MTIEEYNIQEAKKALECELYYEYRNHDGFKVNIYDDEMINDFFGDKDKKEIHKMRENIKRLQEVADGKKLSHIYCLYYTRLYANK